MIKVLFFASLKEQLNCSSIDLSINSLTDNDTTLNVKKVLHEIVNLHPNWQKHLQNSTLLFAVNQTMANENTVVKQGDEIAIFPPVTGG